MRTTLFLSTILSLALLLFGACGQRCDTPDGTATAAWTPVAADALSAKQNEQRKTAMAARDVLFERLSTTLMRTLGEEGPAAAIGVCRDVAPEVARTVGEDHGIRIGRTAKRLRSPANQSPAWAADWVEAEHGENAFAVDAEGTLGVLLPIRLQNACLTCHGDASAIADDVKAQLVELYPDDLATGFAQGDLRGWFWMEVPAVE